MDPVENNPPVNQGNATPGSAPSLSAVNLSSPSYNTRNPAVRRLLHEAREMQTATEQFWARPLEDNLFEWHFTIAGPKDSEFEGGIYHGRITFPPNYPLQPPSFILLNHNGRFETNRKICLSISGHHPETWQPSWSVRTALVALIAFMPTPGAGAIGSLDYPLEERKKLAVKSKTYCCPDCGAISGHLLKPSSDAPSSSTAETSNVAPPTEPEQPASTSPTPQSQTSNTPQPSARFIPPQNIGTVLPPNFQLPFVQNTNNGQTGLMGAGSPPPPYVAAAYMPYLYQNIFNYASFFAHQAAMTAVVTGAAQQRLANAMMGANLGAELHRQPQQQQQPQNLRPADLIAQQQHRERRASAYLFAVILVAWAITRLIDRFLVI